MLPWEKLSGRLDVVVQPWLLISNRSGINLQLFTASSLKDINLPDETAVRLESDSCHIPAAGEVIIFSCFLPILKCSVSKPLRKRILAQ